MNLMITMLAGAPVPRLFGLDSQTLVQIVLMIINVSILAFVLYKALYNPVRKFMQNRAERIKADLNFVEDEKGRVKALELQYDRMLKNNQKERHELLEKARKEGEENRNKIIADAKKEADSIRERAKLQAEMEQERVKDELRQHILEVSYLMSERFLTLAMDKNIYDRLFAETVEELEQAFFVQADKSDS